MAKLYAMQWLRWSILGIITALPGGKLRDYSFGRLKCRLKCGMLPRLVIQELVAKGLIRSCDGLLYPAVNGLTDYERQLWTWLDQHTPDGFPPG
jgi:hypothetical protein